MFISIRYKLFGTLLAAVVVVIVGMFFLIHWSFNRGFLNYVNGEETKRLESLAIHLQETYSEQGDWLFMEGNLRLWRRFLAASTPEGPQQFDPMEDRRSTFDPKNNHRPPGMGHEMRHRESPPRRFPEELRHLFEFRVVLMDGMKSVVVGPRKLDRDEMVITPLMENSLTVGYLGHLPEKNLFSQHQLHFVQEQKKAFAGIALLIASLAALMAFPLASRLLKRMNALACATHQLAAGKFDTRLAVGPSDELGQLTEDFNFLAQTLEKNEQGRRQWLADISHELRTPLAVLRGEIEALEDGVRPSTPEALRSLHSEVMRLNRLMDDLFQLAMSDIGALTYQKESVDVAEIMGQAVGLFRTKFSEKNISLTVETIGDGKVACFADPQRLHQLFANLLNNSLKYTDPGGTLRISGQLVSCAIEILFEDSFPGVLSADMGRLFERLYRVENSRNRRSGGAGLGLSICKNIVEAHNGTIEAKASPFGGLSIRVILSAREKA